MTLALALLAGTGCGKKAAPPTFDNLVLVVVDTLRSDHLPSYGYERATAPYLARLAAEGVQLQGYAATSWTKPSVATLLTGLEPQRHQVIGRADAMPAGLPYLPEVLKRSGFRTAAYVGSPNCSRRWGFDRGFASFGEWSGDGKADGPQVTAGTLQEAWSLRPPFFLYAHYMDPHDPYRPRRPWGSSGDPARRRYVQPERLDARGVPPSPNALQRLRDQYDGEILEVDREIERLVGELSRRGLMSRTLLVVTADHGEELGEHGGLMHGRTLYEEVLKVPFILWTPGGLPHRDSEEVFYLLDFAPTMLQALGRPVPEGMDGLGRWPETLAGSGQGERDLFFHLDLEGHGALALRAGPWKLLHTNRSPFRSLCNLQGDPRETGGTLQDAELSDRLFARLIAHHNRLADSAFERSTVTMGLRLRQSLAALGYLRVNEHQEALEVRVVPDRLSLRTGLARHGRAGE